MRCASGTVPTATSHHQFIPQQLLKLLWNQREQKPLLRAYIDLVKRLWLIYPAESVVESMSSILKEVFGTHRNMKHENAAQELAIWGASSADWG